MAADSGGSIPVFGSRFALLDGNEANCNAKFSVMGKNKKRHAQREVVGEINFTKQQRLDGGDNGSRFLILSRTDKDKTMEDVNPFLIKRAIDAISANIKIERYKNGTLLLKTVNRHQAEKIIKQTKLTDGINIAVIDHPSMNKSKGTIYCPDLKMLKDEEILKELSPSHVSEVKRITRKDKSGKIVETGAFILTFDLGALPSSIDAAFYQCKVRPYVPFPLRCMTCLRYGHKKDQCKGNGICAMCANLFHDKKPCASTLTCVNCRGSHSALSRECPVFIDEFEIQRIRVEERVSLKDARRIRRLRVPNVITVRPNLRESYAAALRNERREEHQQPTSGNSTTSKPTTTETTNENIEPTESSPSHTNQDKPSTTTQSPSWADMMETPDTSSSKTTDQKETNDKQSSLEETGSHLSQQTNDEPLPQQLSHASSNITYTSNSNNVSIPNTVENIIG
ncbi:uncharacterized protein LOC129737742 [Uranotaenia lowii]|uniref:uncharacterized protein LOC129737742 n=1 Tax=Uranotaenia lowii TaxID=190385 RepID=UPI002479F93C|nr:uncharacterized protein LOC129737742 [Uranotaenia lowii]